MYCLQPVSDCTFHTGRCGVLCRFISVGHSRASCRINRRLHAFFLSNHETINARSRRRHNSLRGCRYMERIHIGKAIRAELQRQERGVSWLARHLACVRSNVYRIFRKKSLDTELLSRICTILQHDFFADLSSMVEEQSPNRP